MADNVVSTVKNDPTGVKKKKKKKPLHRNNSTLDLSKHFSEDYFIRLNCFSCNVDVVCKSAKELDDLTSQPKDNEKRVCINCAGPIWLRTKLNFQLVEN